MYMLPFYPTKANYVFNDGQDDIYIPHAPLQYDLGLYPSQGVVDSPVPSVWVGPLNAVTKRI